MVKHLNFEEEKAKCLAKSSKIIYDKSAFIGNRHKEDYVDVYDTENGFIFIQTSSSPWFDPATRYEHWSPEKHSDETDKVTNYSGKRVKHCRGYW